MFWDIFRKKGAVFLNNNNQKCLNDFILATQRWRDWFFLAWYDFKIPYQRTIIGPLWQMLQVGVWVAGLTIIFNQTEGRTTNYYIQYITCGVVFFGFISSIMTASPNLFLQYSQDILNIPMPLFIYVYRMVALNVLNLLFQLPVVFLVIVLVANVNRYTLLSIPALLAYFITAIWVTLLLAILGSRFKDLKYTIASIMRLLFFFSPIFWVPVKGSFRETIAFLNPLTYFLEIIRSPLLGQLPSTAAWRNVLVINLFGIVITLAAFLSCRRRIPFWL